MITNLAEARQRAQAYVAKNTQTLKWASNIPTEPIDITTLAYLKQAATSPYRLIEKTNPFAVRDRIADVRELFATARQARSDYLAIEAQLIQEVLADEQSEREDPEAKFVSNLRLAADGKTAGTALQNPTQIDTLFDLGREYRLQRQVFRAEAGHSFNLGERLAEQRDIYQLTLAKLIAKAEAVALVLSGSFAFKNASLADSVLAGGNPIPNIYRWIVDLLAGLEDHAKGERIVTRFRLLKGNNWYAGDLEAQLRAFQDINIEVPLSRENLGVQATETARILAIGIAPAYNFVAMDIPSAKEIMPYVSNLRALRGQLSFEAAITLSSVQYDHEGDKIDFPAASEFFGGIPCWGIGTGSASQSVSMRSSPTITNRPVGGTAKIWLGGGVIANWGAMHRAAVPAMDTQAEMSPTDIVIGVKIGIY